MNRLYIKIIYDATKIKIVQSPLNKKKKLVEYFKTYFIN